MKANALILGYGEMGHAMQFLLAERHALYIWDKFPAAGLQSVDLKEAAPLADVVMFCLPVNPHREVANEIAPMLKKSCISISIAKGLDEAGQTAAQILSDVFGSKGLDYALLYGPMISEELRAGHYGYAQLACSNSHACQSIQNIFAGSALQIKTSGDVSGISWSVILKNVYAMVFGMADELDLGENTRGFLTVSALHELRSIVQKLGGESDSVYDLAGLGDLIATATSEDSHHHALGRKLARGDRSDIKGEGVHTLQMVEKHALFPWAEYPLFSLLHEVVVGKRDPATAIVEFLRLNASDHF